MPLNAHSPEFSRLVLRWLDETATPDEEAVLWQSVSDSPECAREMAALTRFESLLGEVTRGRAEMRLAERQLEKTAGPRMKGEKAGRHGIHLLRMAAVLFLAGTLVWLAWPYAVPSLREIAEQKEQKKTLVSPQRILAGTSGLVGAHPQAVSKPLPERLDAFFLPRVDLHQMSLREALSVLQGQLLELNHLKSEALEKLRVTLPADAAMRKITFHSGPISFLKAVRAVAALGGCDVKIDEQSLALILHREIFPQLPEKRQILALLDGRLGTDGKPAAEDPQRVASLMEDVSALGINGDPRTADVPVTRGQWEALRLMTEAREQWRSFALPGFQLYFVEDSAEKKDRVLSESEVDQIRTQNVPPALETAPGQMTQPLPGYADRSPALQLTPVGEVIEVSIPMDLVASVPDSQLSGTSNAVLAGGTLNLASGEGAMVVIRADSLTLSGGTNSTSNGSVIILVPKNPTP